MTSLSLIANRWLRVTNFEYSHRDYAAPHVPSTAYNDRQLLNVEPHIAHMRLPVLSDTLVAALRTHEFKSWALRNAMIEGPNKLYDLIAARFPTDSPVKMLPREDLYTPSLDLCVVKSNLGEIAFPTDFDQLANAFAMAAQGAVIEISVTGTECAPTATIDVRRPTMTQAKRRVPLTPKTLR